MEMPLWIPALIFVARITDVSMATVRMILLTNGIKFWSTVIGFFEVIIWVLAVGGALNYLDNPIALFSYAAGFATGVFVGIVIEEKIAIGFRLIRVINTDREIDLSLALRGLRWRVTQVEGHGMKGPVEICFTAIRRRDVALIRRQIHEIAPSAFVTVERVDRPTGGTFGGSTAIASPFNRFSLRK